MFSSGNKRYTFETSRQELTSIDTTRLTSCCSVLFIYNYMLLIVECLKWSKHFMFENECVGYLGLLLCSFCCLSWCLMGKNVTYWTSVAIVAIEYCYYPIKTNIAHQNDSFHIWQWQTNERVWQHLLIVTFRSFNKSIPFDPLWYSVKSTLSFWANLTWYLECY